MAELVDALDLGSSGATRESSSLSFRTKFKCFYHEDMPMQVSIESSTGLERQLKIGVPADRIEQEVTARLQKATKTVSIKGFRKGKVPLKVMLSSIMVRAFAKRLLGKSLILVVL